MPAPSHLHLRRTRTVIIHFLHLSCFSNLQVSPQQTWHPTLATNSEQPLTDPDCGSPVYPIFCSTHPPIPAPWCGSCSITDPFPVHPRPVHLSPVSSLQSPVSPHLSLPFPPPTPPPPRPPPPVYRYWQFPPAHTLFGVFFSDKPLTPSRTLWRDNVGFLHLYWPGLHMVMSLLLAYSPTP
ncbi:uncharacterized protein LY79DRAFT_169646 [Colletotrichum navitas]|uniref:Uncharacterized protein n=1 Tax=Colletotrichum navitas TaxID=681940 RepID=A0AAD8UWH9_9PEZI|nr:uncharacterized protein LY79DRAFT_169646 [Colletotrichum navitas]KAK1564039.1 hypothetical protein LY79DRAFT_169646 [Colletotrichum navitas]